VRDNGYMVRFEEFETKTGGRLDAVDITQEVVDTVRSAGVRQGSVLVFSPHTTCAVMISSNGRRMLEALEHTIEAIAPLDEYYAHDDLKIRTENLVEDEPANGPAHILHVFMGKASECVPISDGRIALGEDQRVLFVELDSSRLRRYCIQVIGE
jgi:secondary thiamine-phosphate synthase enzyme